MFLRILTAMVASGGGVEVRRSGGAYLSTEFLIINNAYILIAKVTSNYSLTCRFSTKSQKNHITLFIYVAWFLGGREVLNNWHQLLMASARNVKWTRIIQRRNKIIIKEEFLYQSNERSKFNYSKIQTKFTKRKVKQVYSISNFLKLP